MIVSLYHTLCGERDTPPEDFNITGVPAGFILVNAYVWITTVDDAIFDFPGSAPVFDFTFDGTARTASLLNRTSFAGGTCWNPSQPENYNMTSVFYADVTAEIQQNITNTGNINDLYTLDYNLASALRYTPQPAPPFPTTFDVDVTGATMLVIYKRACTTGEHEGRLVLWHGLDVVQSGQDEAYFINNLGAYQNNINEEAFFVISDVQSNGGTQYNINGSSPDQNINGNMHNFVSMTNPNGGFASGQQSVEFNILGDGNDCYAVTVLGAYMQDGSHVCNCVAPPYSTFDLCEEYATNLITMNGGNATVNTGTGRININGTFTVDANITFNNCLDIQMGPHSKIEVLPGFTLTLIDSKLQPCDYFWDGIYVRDATASIVANNTEFWNAENAIVSEDNGNYELDDCLFSECWRGMIVRDYNPFPATTPHQGYVRGCVFECTTDLIPPHSFSRSFLGIEVNRAYGVTIGYPEDGNTFTNMTYGIYSLNSQVFVYNNVFNDIYRVPYSNSFVLSPPQEGGVYAIKNGFLAMPGFGITVGSQLDPSYANQFNTCNVGVFSNRLKTNVENNEFNNSLKGVWAQNLVTGSTVSHNIFTNTSSYLGKGTAIQAENITAPATKTRLTIRDNEITDYQHGIWARNIASQAFSPNARPFWVYSNEIDYTTTNNTLQRYGIRIEKCNFAIVAKNSVVKNTNPGTGENTRLRGIFIANSNKALVYDNYPITKMGQGIYTTGTVVGSQFYCNRFDYNYNGFFFGPGTAIGQQGTTQLNTANEWTTEIGKRLASNNGYLQVYDVDWYFNSNLGAKYNPNPSTNLLLSNVTDHISFVLNTTSLDNCGSAAQPPDAIVETPDEDEREAQFGAIMRNENDYDAFETAYKQYDNEYAYLIFKNDNDWLDLGADDADYEAWYDSVENSNIGQFLALRELADTLLTGVSFMQAQPMDTAAWFLGNITPTNTLESNELAVWDVYFRTFAMDNFELSSADSATLFNIAYQSGSEGGIAVYMARIMLNIDVDLGESNKTDEDFFPEVDGEENRNFILYPNPAKDEVNVLFNGYEQGETVKIEFYELTGRRSIATQASLSGSLITINTVDLEAGIYLYNITLCNGEESKGKLVLVK